MYKYLYDLLYFHNVSSIIIITIIIITIIIITIIIIYGFTSVLYAGMRLLDGHALDGGEEKRD